MIQIKNLNVKTKNKKQLLQDICLEFNKGNVVGITGKSGSGKTTLIKSILGMLDNHSYKVSGDIFYKNEGITDYSQSKRRELCGIKIGYIPQNLMTAFDPRIRIGKQVEETLCIRMGLDKKTAVNAFLENLKTLNLFEEKRILESYPREISGGMLQRIAVALTLSMRPEYILADEPTSALDEENRDLLIKVLLSKKDEIGILFVSHDIKALCALCKEVNVMENGKFIERGNMDILLNNPQTWWTKTFSEVYKNGKERSFVWTK